MVVFARVQISTFVIKNKIKGKLKNLKKWHKSKKLVIIIGFFVLISSIAI